MSSDVIFGDIVGGFETAGQDATREGRVSKDGDVILLCDVEDSEFFDLEREGVVFHLVGNDFSRISFACSLESLCAGLGEEDVAKETFRLEFDEILHGFLDGPGSVDASWAVGINLLDAGRQLFVKNSELLTKCLFRRIWL